MSDDGDYAIRFLDLFDQRLCDPLEAGFELYATRAKGGVLQQLNRDGIFPAFNLEDFLFDLDLLITNEVLNRAGGA